ncbi:MAG: NAD(P)H-binding protein [Chitinivibrionales bacterium]|nr:NAD(P)H-binding protein [Chitinivibrionales bacterium]
MVVITGATGNTGSKISQLLIRKMEKVVLLGRSVDKLKKFLTSGVTIMAGDQSDPKFLTNAFSGADAVYLMIPPKYDADDLRKYYGTLGDAAIMAMKDAQVKKIVFLSSLGADLDSGTGPIMGLRDVEQKLSTLKNVDIVFLRAGYFMENMLSNIPLIKNKNINGNTADPEALISMVATKDIAERAATLLLRRDFKGHSVVEVFGHRISYQEATAIIGREIGEPDLRYIKFSDEDALRNLMASGISRSVAESFIEMARALNLGRISARLTDPTRPTTATKFDQFVEEVFIPAYSNTK